MSKKCMLGVVITCVMGIVIGSFFDFQISEALANKNKTGQLFADFGCYFAYCLFPAAGACIYKGLNKKGKQYGFLAVMLFAAAYFMASFYTFKHFGEDVLDLLGFVPRKKSPSWKAVLGYFIIIVSYAWIPPVALKIFDDENAVKLICIGSAILIAGFLADSVNEWLKQFASRPRYKYLLTLEDPAAEFRNWWQIRPGFSGGKGSFESLPSGHVTRAATIFALPMLAEVLKKRSKAASLVSFAVSCFFILLYGYNRIHMMNHFLSDVCFAVLITYMIFYFVNYCFEKVWKAVE